MTYSGSLELLGFSDRDPGHIRPSRSFFGLLFVHPPVRDPEAVARATRDIMDQEAWMDIRCNDAHHHVIVRGKVGTLFRAQTATSPDRDPFEEAERFRMAAARLATQAVLYDAAHPFPEADLSMAPGVTIVQLQAQGQAGD